MLPSARPLTTSWPMTGSEPVFLDRPDQFRRFALVAIDAKRMRKIAKRIGLISNQHAFPVAGGGERVANGRLVAAHFLDDRFEHVDRVVIRHGEIVGRYFVFVLHALGPIENFGVL